MKLTFSVELFPDFLTTNIKNNSLKSFYFQYRELCRKKQNYGASNKKREAGSEERGQCPLSSHQVLGISYFRGTDFQFCVFGLNSGDRLPILIADDLRYNGVAQDSGR